MYWQKRCTIRWATFGGENTKFFHAAATERYRKNLITHLQTDDGRVLTQHNEKAQIIFQTFQQRMRVSLLPVMHFDLQSLVSHNDSLAHLSENFSISEIDEVVKRMPIDRAPSPMVLMDALLKVVGLLLGRIFTPFVLSFVKVTWLWKV